MQEDAELRLEPKQFDLLTGSLPHCAIEPLNVVHEPCGPVGRDTYGDRGALLSIEPAVRAQTLTVRFPLTGFIPPPLIFGAGIDSTCLFWSTFCGEQGACVLYDNVAYRYLYVSIAIALKSFAFLLYTTTWQCLRKNYKRYIKNHEGGLSTSEFFASTLTLDNLGRDPVPANQTHRTKFIYNLEDHEWCENMESVL